jgi:hypothetical protein
MAKVIEFYVPTSFKKKATKRMPADQKGKVLQFSSSQENRLELRSCFQATRLFQGPMKAVLVL